MFAQIGSIEFELLKGFTSVQESRKWEWAEHQVLDSKPHLQRMGEGLVEFALKVKISLYSGHDPAEFASALYAEAGKNEALPFILGSGEVVGEFVILDVGKSWQRCDNLGRLLSAEFDIKIKEYR